MDGRAQSDVAPEPSQLEQALLVMLRDGLLPAQERLDFFRISKRMAQAVLRHAACTHLTLALGLPVAAAGGSSKRRRVRTSSSSAHVVAQQLAAESPNVSLALHGEIFAPDACLWPRITTIQLHDISISSSTSSLLQLNKLPRLHNLSLRQCSMADPMAKVRAQHRSNSVRTLESINSQSDNSFTTVDCPHLLNPTQLQTLITNEAAASVTPLLSQLPALQELRLLTPQTGPAAVVDDDFERLLTHQALVRVELPQTDLRSYHAVRDCYWDSLVLDEANIIQLDQMPLAGLQSCIVRGRMIAKLRKNASWAATIIDMVNGNSGSPPQSLVLQAAPNHAGCRWQPTEPAFTLSMHDGHFELGNEQAEVIAFTMRHLAPGTALIIEGIDTIRQPAILASLAAAPATLTTICFKDIEHGGRNQNAGVFTHLPGHVSHVILDAWYRESSDWRDLLDMFVNGVQRPLRLTLVGAGDRRRPGDPWDKEKKQDVRDWLADHACQHLIQVEFQNSADV